MDYIVTGPAVVLPTKDGSERYLYRGGIVPSSGFTAAGIKHAVSIGLLGEYEPIEIEVQVTEVAPTSSAPDTDANGNQKTGDDRPDTTWSHDRIDAWAVAQTPPIVFTQEQTKRDEKLAAIAATEAQRAQQSA